MTKIFRVIDTGIEDGRRNIAFDQALIDARAADEAPDTIRFLQFRPTALVGRHQALSREVDLDYCTDQGIGTARRITGGGSIFFDEGQLGWELAFHRSTLGISDLGELSGTICEAAAAGIRSLGVNAQFRPRNDIEVDGKKISGTGGFFDGDVLFYQGTLLIDTNPEVMAKALKVPQAKLAKRDLDSAAARVTTLCTLLDENTPDLETIKRALLDGFAEGLGLEPEFGDVSEAEIDRWAAIYDEEIGTDEFVTEIDDPEVVDDFGSSSAQTPGGSITVYVRMHRTGIPRLQHVLITGDFFANPPRVVFDLEARLKDAPVDEVDKVLSEVLGGGAMITVPQETLSLVIKQAAGAS